MINMTNRPNVQVRLRALELLLRHLRLFRESSSTRLLAGV
jgi:hypothetical protein